MAEILSFLKDLNLAFDFDATINSKKKIQIKGAELYINDKKVEEITDDCLNVQEAAKITTVCATKLEEANTDHFESLGTEALIKELQYVIQLIDTLTSIKHLHCQSGAWNGTYSKYEQRLTSILNRYKYHAQQATAERSYPERLALLNVDCAYEDSLDHYNLLELNSITDILTKIKETAQQITAFDYSSYPFSKEHTNLIKEQGLALCDSRDKEYLPIKNFIDKSGDAIIDWGDRKILYELRKAEIDATHFARKIVEKHRDMLIASGKTPKIAKRSAIDVSKSLMAHGKATQEDLIRVYKQGDAGSANFAVASMTWDSILELMTSTLSVVQNRITQLENGSYFGITAACPLTNKAMELAKTPEQIQAVITFVSIKKLWSHTSLDFINKATDYLTKEELINLGSSIKGIQFNDIKLFSKHTYNKFIQEVTDETELYKLSDIVTETLFHFGGEKAILKAFKLYPCIYVAESYWVERCKNISYTKIHKYLQKNLRLVTIFSKKVIENNDVSLVRSYYNSKETAKGNLATDLIAILPVCERPKYYTLSNCYWVKIPTLKNAKEIQEMLQSIIKLGLEVPKSLVPQLIEQCCDNNYWNSTITELLKKYQAYPLEVSSELIPKLPKEIRILIVKFMRLDFEFGYRSVALDNALDFFKPFNSNDIATLWGNNIPTEYLPYIAHTMPTEEVIAYADKDNKFLSINVQLLPYSYLKKFKDEKVIKAKLGDMREYSNQNIKRTILRTIKEFEMVGGAK